MLSTKQTLKDTLGMHPKINSKNAELQLEVMIWFMIISSGNMTSCAATFAT